jgi:single-stranded-DNA-specific exonuclease
MDETVSQRKETIIMKEYYEVKVSGSLGETVARLNGFEDVSAVRAADSKTVHYPTFVWSVGFKGRLEALKAAGTKIAVIGDYDCDGIMATAIMLKGLKAFGIECMGFLPNRFVDGYGLSESLVKKAHDAGCGAIITVDNGISAIDAAKAADALGISLIITDHHVPGRSLPECAIAFDPQIPGCLASGMKEICGAEVAFFLLIDALGSFLSPQLTAEMRQLASVAVISDVMPLRDVNRQLVRRLIFEAGTEQIMNPGLEMLMEDAGPIFTEESLMFGVCPMLNASGRLKSPDIALRFIMSDASEDGCLLRTRYFDKLKALNEIRKDLTFALMNDPTKLMKLRVGIPSAVITETHPYNEGLIGLVAGRECEETGKPSFCFTFTPDNGAMKGSGRSVPGYNLIEAARKAFEKHPEWGRSFGGHAGAMGLTLANLQEVCDFSAEIAEDFGKADVPAEKKPYISFPAGMSLDDAYAQLNELRPFGEGMLMPVFRIRGTIPKASRLGRGTMFVLDGMTFCFFNREAPEGEHDIYFRIVKDATKETSAFCKAVVEEIV